MTEAVRESCLMPTESLLTGHTPVTLDEDNAGRFLSGLRRRGSWPDTQRACVFGASPRALLGSAHIKAGELIPGRLLSPLEIGQLLDQQKKLMEIQGTAT